MFIRKNKNRNGSISIQIIQKIGRKNKILKTVGCAKTQREEELLLLLARNEVEKIQGLQSLFIEHDDLVIDSFIESIENDNLKIVGPQIVLGRLYEWMGYSQIDEREFFKNLVICRLVYPVSKLKTVEYFKRHLNIDVSVYSVYRFLDDLHSRYKSQVEQITFEYTYKILKGRIGIVFYDVTTLYFEASEEDDLRIPGFSKDGKHQQPQIMIGLLVGRNGYPIGYEIFEGNTSETNTLIPVLESFQRKFGIERPVIVADAAMLSQKNIDALKKEGYEFILGGRVKNENDAVKEQILALKIKENRPKEITCENGRLILTYSRKRAGKDLNNRMKGLKRLEKKVKSGKLKKEHINNRGYNKYLKLEGIANISIDYDKFNQDGVWDGIKGYVSNTSLTKNQIIGTYQQLWLIEKAFRISKTDLKIRPVYHRLEGRIEAHICICFTAYAIYKELERLLLINRIGISPEKAIEEIKDIRQLTYMLPKSGKIKSKLLKLNDMQSKLLDINF